MIAGDAEAVEGRLIARQPSWPTGEEGNSSFGIQFMVVRSNRC
jgi:hypothetical protein